jgi:hypothetical protein
MQHELFGRMAIAAENFEYAATDLDHILCDQPTESWW